ncbi:hypothetical protein SAMN04489740_4046 [Arthrobacter alpinus]|uniref:Uncharacterized protein n=1 Tax=Arthrobacter alpinus TaxID=656366 RepID=A0A1H5PAX2_9MICC|nr:hypothetical protein SAMN04489740_4046 [Arthrobacter alpinus]
MRNAARSPHIEPNVPDLRTSSKAVGDTSAVKFAQSTDQMIHPTPRPRQPAANLTHPLIANSLVFRIFPPSLLVQRLPGVPRSKCNAQVERPIDRSPAGRAAIDIHIVQVLRLNVPRSDRPTGMTNADESVRM